MKIVNNRKLEFSSAAGICTAVIAACLAFAPQARAITFDGKASGKFVSPTGPSGTVMSGVGTNHFQWGLPVDSYPSQLIFGGKGFTDVATDELFDLGTLSYFNGTALGGTEAYSVDFRATLAFTSPLTLTKNFNFDFKLVNTPNIGTPTHNADTIFLTSLFPTTTTTFPFDGIDYTLKIGFGTVTGGGFSKVVDKFSVYEDQWAHAKLVGLITAINPPPPSVPDTGSTLGLMAMAIVGVGGLRQYLARKTA